MIIILMQILTIIFNIYIAFTEKRKRIYIATFLLNLSQLIMYLSDSDLTAGLIYVIVTIRSLIYIYKEKFSTNSIPYIIIIIQLVIGYLTLENWLQIVSVLLPCYSCWYLWFSKDTQELRMGNIIANSAWAIYNFANGLYIILIMRAIAIGSNLIAYINKRKELSKKLKVKHR